MGFQYFQMSAAAMTTPAMARPMGFAAMAPVSARNPAAAALRPPEARPTRADPALLAPPTARAFIRAMVRPTPPRRRFRSSRTSFASSPKVARYRPVLLTTTKAANPPTRAAIAKPSPGTDSRRLPTAPATAERAAEIGPTTGSSAPPKAVPTCWMFWENCFHLPLSESSISP